MNLESAITRALDLTREIRDALAGNDLARALSLIPVRAEAMERLQEAHRSASAGEMAACRALTRELHELDEALQEDAGARLDDAARDLHAATGHPGSRPDSQPCLTSCIDRRA